MQIADRNETKLQVIINNATRNHMSVNDARQKIVKLLASLRGSQPGTGDDGGKSPSQDGLLNELHESLSGTESQLGALHADIDELLSLLDR